MKMSFEGWYATFYGRLSTAEKRQAKDVFRAAFKAGRGKGGFAEFMAAEPLVTYLPVSTQALMTQPLFNAFCAGRL